MNQYQARVDEERIQHAKHPDVKKLVREIRDESTENVEIYLQAGNPRSRREGQRRFYYCQSVIDHAHMLIDQAHERFRAPRLRADPQPKEEDDDGEDAA